MVLRYRTLPASDLLSAADEVNHLQPIAFAQHCLSPFVPANDFTVEFECDSRRRQRELIHEITQGRVISNISILTIDLDAQFSLLRHLSQRSSRQDDPAQL